MTTVLTVDQVRARRRGDELLLSKMAPALRDAALHYAGAYLSGAQACVGKSRGELEGCWNDIPVGGKDIKLAAGLRKLVTDRCEFEVSHEIEPAALRTKLFTAAAEARFLADKGPGFDRQRLIATVADSLGVSPDALEQNLYGDLKDAHRLLAVRSETAEGLLAAYELGQAQAVLLRAVKLTVRVEDQRASAYRDLFRAIKFRRLLAEIYPEGQGYRIEIDGPLSLFSAATKYGLALAMLLPTIRGMQRWSLKAEVRWGKERRPLTFSDAGSGGAYDDSEPQLPDELARLLEKWAALSPAWQVETRAELLNIPGAGVIAPDLAFVHEPTGEVVYFELMGYWSRDAVWKRLELVEAGLSDKVLFACSAKLRVSEAVFPDDVPSSLLVYKGSISPKRLLEQLELLRSR